MGRMRNGGRRGQSQIMLTGDVCGGRSRSKERWAGNRGRQGLNWEQHPFYVKARTISGSPPLLFSTAAEVNCTLLMLNVF